MRKSLFNGLFVYLFLCLFPLKAEAQVMSSDSYTIEKQNVEIGKFRPLPTPTTTPVIEKHFASGENYTIDTTNASEISITTSHDEINFGKLTATNPVIRLLYLSTTSNKPYHVLASENHPLSDGAKSIPDTTCDNGSCTAIIDALWTSTLTYGFGYQQAGMPTTNYLHFPDWSQNEAHAHILQSFKAKNKQTKLTFKVNIPATQQDGQYKNTVTFIASPTF